MRLASILPHMGTAATPASILRAAQQAEALDYSSLWVAERLLFPVKPRTPYPATPDGSLPDFYQRVFEPIETLTWVAAQTTKIRVGTSVLNMPFHNPALLAKRLATLDVLSGGRLAVGLGQGWSQDEMEAAGAPTRGKADRADEFVQVLRTMWGPDPVEHHGTHFQIAASINGARSNMVLDTGASAVVLTQEAAKAAGLPLEVLNYSVTVDTANGRTRAAPVTLDRVAVGTIVERSVPALIAQPGQLRTNLLGMSFLNRLESWEVRGDKLVMRGYR